MKLKQTLMLMGIVFCIVAIAVPLILSIITILTGDYANTIYAQDLYRYPFVAFLSVLPTLLYIGSDSISTVAWRIRKILHAILTIGIVVVMQFVYGWLVIEWMNLRNMWLPLFMVAGLYVSGIIIARIRMKWLSKKLSERIHATYRTDNDEPPEY